MLPVFWFVAIFSILLWLTTYTTLRNGILMKQILLIPYKVLPVFDIKRVEPHKNNLKWGYGTVVIVTTKLGEELTLQPNHPTEFLAALRREAPQAEFLV